MCGLFACFHHYLQSVSAQGSVLFLTSQRLAPSRGPLSEYLVKTHRAPSPCQSDGPCRHTCSCLPALPAASLLSLPAQGPSLFAWTSDDAHLLPQNIHCLQQPVISLHSRQSTSPGHGDGGSSERPVPTFPGTRHSNPRVLGLSGVPPLCLEGPSPSCLLDKQLFILET